MHALTNIDPWFLVQIEDIIKEEAADEGRRCPARSRRIACAGSSARASPTAASRSSSDVPEKVVRNTRRELGVVPVLQARRYLRGGVLHVDGLHVLDLRGRVRSQSDEQAEDHDPGRRSEPHRPGHRVRLLLRARGARPARGRVRDHHGQLQPGDGLDGLRHVRPPVLRAADARRRARSDGEGKAGRRDRAVRRPDAAEADRARWKRPARRSSAPRRTRSTSPKTASASRTW